jgi:hypothetical protein
MLITNRTDIDVPKEYIRSFEVPDGLKGDDLGQAIKGKVKHRCGWLYLDLQGLNFRGADLSFVNLWEADLRQADLRYADFTLAELRYSDLRETKLNGAYLRRADLRGADLHYAKNVDFSDTRFTCLTKHERVISIPEIEWGGNPIAAVMPEGNQPLLISIGCQTHTPEVWASFTTYQLMEMDEDAPEWCDDHMESAIKKAYELEAEFLKNS